MHHTTEELLATLPEDADTPPPCAPSAAGAVAATSSPADGVGARVPEQFQGVVNSILGGVPAAGEQAESSGLGSLLGAAEGLLGGHNS